MSTDCDVAYLVGLVHEVEALLPDERPEKEQKPLGKNEMAKDAKMRDTTDLNTVPEKAET